MTNKRFHPPTADQQILISEDRTTLIVESVDKNTRRAYTLANEVPLDPNKKIQNASLSGESTPEERYFSGIISMLEYFYLGRFVMEVIDNDIRRIRERSGFAQQNGGVGPYLDIYYNDPTKLELVIEACSGGPFPMQWSSVGQREVLDILGDLTIYLNTGYITTPGWLVKYQALDPEDNINLLTVSYMDYSSQHMWAFDYIDYAKRIASLFHVVPDITQYPNYKEGILDDPNIESLWKPPLNINKTSSEIEMKESTDVTKQDKPVITSGLLSSIVYNFSAKDRADDRTGSSVLTKQDIVAVINRDDLTEAENEVLANWFGYVFEKDSEVLLSLAVLRCNSMKHIVDQ